MNKLLSLSTMFALTTTLSFACDANKGEAACIKDAKCEWKDNKCSTKPDACSAHKDDTACGTDDKCEWKDNKCQTKPEEPVDCSTRDTANCAGADKKCELKAAEGDKPEKCVAVKK